MGRDLIKTKKAFLIALLVGSIPLMKAGENQKLKENCKKTNNSDHHGSSKSFKSHKKLVKVSGATLPKIIQEALNHHPSIEADKEALSATDDMIDQAKADYMPSVDVRVSFGRSKYQRSFQINALTPLPSAGALSITHNDPSITIRQNLFDGMATASRVSKAHSQRRHARGTLGVTTDTAIIDIASAVIDMRRLQRLLRIVESNIQFHAKMKERIQEIVNAGAISISDLFQANSRLQDTLISKANILSDLEVAFGGR